MATSAIICVVLFIYSSRGIVSHRTKLPWQASLVLRAAGKGQIHIHELGRLYMKQSRTHLAVSSEHDAKSKNSFIREAERAARTRKCQQ